MPASILANQPTGAGAGSPGIARNDLRVGHVVELEAFASPGANTLWRWYILDKPPGSNAEVTAEDGTPYAEFEPDLRGTYRVKLVTNGGGPGEEQIRVYRARFDAAGALLARGYCMPALLEGLNEANYASNQRGFDEPLRFFMDDVAGIIDGMAEGIPPEVSTLLDTLVTDLGDLEAVVAGHSVDLDALDSRVTANEGALLTADSRLDSLESGLAVHEIRLDAIEAEMGISSGDAVRTVIHTTGTATDPLDADAAPTQVLVISGGGPYTYELDTTDVSAGAEVWFDITVSSGVTTGVLLKNGIGGTTLTTLEPPASGTAQTGIRVYFNGTAWVIWPAATGGGLTNPHPLFDQVFNDTGATGTVFNSTSGFSAIAAGQVDLASTGGDTWLRSETGQVFVGGMTIDQYSDDWWNAESGTSLWFTSGTDMQFDAGSSMSFTSATGMVFDNTGGSSGMDFGTNGTFYVASNGLSISNNDSSGSALFYSHGEMDIEARSNLLIRARVLGSADTLASSLSIVGANATTGSTGSTNRRGGAVIIDVGRGRTPGTDEPGPIYVGIGDPVTATTGVANGWIMGYGPAVGTVGSADYKPYATELCRHSYIAGEYKITSPLAIRVVAVSNFVAEGSTGVILNVAAVTKFIATTTTTTIANSGTVQVQSTGGAAHLIAGAICSLNGATLEYRSSNRVSNFQNGNAAETYLSLRGQPDIAIASTASTYTTLMTLAVSGATGTAPVTVSGIAHVYEAAGATQKFRFEVTFRPNGATGAMVGSPLIDPYEGDLLGSLEIDSTGGCRLRFLSDASSTNTKTARVTDLEFK